jgi:hypothetical protein
MKLNSLLYLSKIIVGISICCLFFCPVTFAQSDTTKSSINPNVISHGKWAVDFRLGRLFSGRYSGNYYINGRYFWTPKIMTRISTKLKINSSLGHLSNRQEIKNIDSLFVISDEYSYLTSSDYVVLFNYFMHNIYPDKNYQIIIGIGPFIGYSMEYSWDKNRRSQGNSYSNFYDIRKFDLGISGILGAEWFFRKWLSISAEYGANFYYRNYQYSYRSNYSHGVVATHRNEYDFETQDFVVGFSVYF